MRQNAPCEGRRGRDYVRLLASQGRRGDTLVAHISPLEAAILRLLGGAGTINPKTGLLEFSPMGGQAGGNDGTGKGLGVGGGHDTSGGRTGPGGNQTKSGAVRGSGTTGTVGAVGSKYGNENAAIGVLSRNAANVTKARNSMSTGAFHTAVAQTGNPQSDLSRAWHGLLQSLGLEDDPEAQADPDSVAGVVKQGASYMSQGTGPLSDVAAAIGFGAQLGDEAENKIDAISSGLESGTVANTNQGRIGVQNGSAYGGGINSGTTDVSKLSHDIGNGSFAGGDLGGYARDHNNGGNNNLDHATLAQRAQQANSGGGQLAAADLQVVPAPAPTGMIMPIGLFQYLAQNPGLLQGLTTQSRFGAGSVAPINYLRPYP